MAYELALKFIDQSSSFAHGFRLGQIEEKLNSFKSFKDLITREEVLQVDLMCKRYLATYSILPLNEEWFNLIVVSNIYKIN